MKELLLTYGQSEARRGLSKKVRDYGSLTDMLSDFLSKSQLKYFLSFVIGALENNQEKERSILID